MMRIGVGFFLLLMFSAPMVHAQEATQMEYTKVETAVLDPANWDKSFPNQLYFDALRPMLVRFPGLADALMDKLNEGYRIEKVEVVLEWERTEGARPERGRHGWGAEPAYTNDPGLWHALVRPMLKPWTAADEALAPTADAYLPNSYWSEPVARGNGSDRFARTTFGPLPLHQEIPIARIDLTELLNDTTFAPSIAAGLRSLEERGLQVLKQELFDPKYNGQDGEWFDVYSWRSGVGYMRIWTKSPKVIVHLAKDAEGAVKAGALPPPTDLSALVNQLREQPSGKSFMTPPDDWAERARRFNSKPDGMPDWQWQRRQELVKLNGWNLGRIDIGPVVNSDATQYDRIGGLLDVYPRHWAGHLTSDFALVPAAVGEMLPPAVIDHLKLFWQGWLHPEAEDAENPRVRSYFRQYNWTLGTQNFNFNSIAGSYLASEFFGFENSLRDAEYGVENIMLRLFEFYNGSNQEVGDTYYQALSVAGIQMVAKYAQDPLYKLMARIGAEKQLEQIVSMYNPNIRRVVHPMGRGEMKYQCAFQDGPYFALHTLSPNGVLMELDQPFNRSKYGIRLFGSEGPPARMALLSPWADAHWSNAVDAKNIPWQSTAAWWHLLPDNAVEPEYHINYISRHYSLSSRSEDGNPVTHVTAQWRKSDAPVSKMEDLATLQFSFGGNGRVEQAMASWGIVHHGGKLIAMKALPPKGYLTFPPNPDYGGGWRAQDESRGKDAFNAIHASAIIIDFGDVSSREIWLGNRKIEQLSGDASPRIDDPRHQFERHLGTTGKNSVYAKSGETIFINNGVTYAALTPLAFNALSRDEEVEIAYEWPVLYIHAFLYRGKDAISQEQWYGAEEKATAGFVLEMGDASEFGSFEGFRQHIAKSTLKAEWNAERRLADIEYRTGEDTLQMGFTPWTMPQWNVREHTRKAAVYRSVNGRWPYLPPGIQRDTPWSIQGSTGHLEKNGAVLESEAGYRAYLLAEPVSGVVTAYNPLPDPIFWSLTLPNGGEIRADGRLGLLRLQYDPQANTLHVDHQLKDEQKEMPDIATALVASNFDAAPKVILNGKTAARPSQLPDRLGYVIPLVEGVDVAALPGRLAAATEKWQQVKASKAQETYFRDWYVVGPFPNGGYNARFFHLREFGPEEGYSPDAAYTGLTTADSKPVEAEVKWKAALSGDAPVLSDQPFDLLPLFDPRDGVIAYASAIIVSDQERTVQLHTGGDERLAVWVNGERVIFNRGYRVAFKDQDRVQIKLNRGDNEVLVKLCHGYESWRLYFRLADEWGLPLTEGVWYRGQHGLTPAGM